jgi:hypothetical protein
MAFGEIYKYTWWGKVVTGGFGAIYQALISLVGTLLSALNNRAENYENNTATDAILVPLEDSGLLDKASIILTPTAYSNGSINVVKPEYQVLPTELITNGTFDTDTSGWTQNNSSLSVVDGRLRVTQTGAGFGIAQTIITTEIGKKYKFSWDYVIGTASEPTARVGSSIFGSDLANVSASSGVVYFTATTTTSYVNFRMTVTTSGLYSDFDNVSVKEIQEADFDFVRATTATRVNELGLIEEVAAGIPRIDYSSGVGQWLFEPLRTNYIQYTEDFSIQWTRENLTPPLLNVTTAPDGETTADKLIENTNNSFHGIYVLAQTTAASIYTYCRFI